MTNKTFIKLAEVTLTGNYTNINFTSISQNYTHLVLLGSLRQNTAAYYANAFIKINNTTTGYYGLTMEGGNGVPTVFNDSTGNTGVRFDQPSGGSVSSNQFSTLEVWFHNYTSSSHKGGTAEMYVGNQNTSTFIDRRVWHWDNTSPISSLYITTGAGQFVSGSTLTLYGIGQEGSTNTGSATASIS